MPDTLSLKISYKLTSTLRYFHSENAASAPTCRIYCFTFYNKQKSTSLSTLQYRLVAKLSETRCTILWVFDFTHNAPESTHSAASLLNFRKLLMHKNTHTTFYGAFNAFPSYKLVCFVSLDWSEKQFYWVNNKWTCSICSPEIMKLLTNILKQGSSSCLVLHFWFILTSKGGK